MKKGLASLFAGVGLFLSACGPAHFEYNFNGTLDGEHVRYTAFGTPADVNLTNRLDVAKVDGTQVTYIDDMSNDLQIEKLLVIKDGVTNAYWHNPSHVEVMKVGQAKFNDYLKRIQETKRESGLRNLGKR